MLHGEALPSLGWLLEQQLHSSFNPQILMGWNYSSMSTHVFRGTPHRTVLLWAWKICSKQGSQNLQRHQGAFHTTFHSNPEKVLSTAGLVPLQPTARQGQAAGAIWRHPGLRWLRNTTGSSIWTVTLRIGSQRTKQYHLPFLSAPHLLYLLSESNCRNWPIH